MWTSLCGIPLSIKGGPGHGRVEKRGEGGQREEKIEGLGDDKSQERR
jgi:hypothetical protein